MELKVGNVIVLPFVKHQENNEGEARWCIVTEILQDEFEIVPLTKKTNQAKNYTDTIIIKKKSAEGKQMGIEHNSLIILDRRLTFKLSFFKKLLIKGQCTEELIDKLIE